jgi:type IV pilus assembly protein PilY1
MTMKPPLISPLHASNTLACVIFSTFLCANPIVWAAQTDLSNVPLANVEGTVSVKPNVMFILDDSGSMQWDYTPDYIDDAKTSLTPPYTAKLGDPPYMSPHYNKQYYNPNITYSPGLAYDGGTTQGSLSLLPQNASNTSNWTAVSTDPYNKQNRNQLGTTATSVNLVTGYPDRVYCTSTSDSATNTTKCVTNSSAFTYADNYDTSTTTPFIKGLDTSDNPKYRYGAPYYFNILVGEYCSDEALTNCQAVSPGSSAPSGFPYPARVRWCSSSAEANKAIPTSGTCQGKRVGSFTTPRFAGSSVATVASGSLTVNSGTADSASITQINVNGVNIISGAVTASTGTDTSTKRNNLATALVNSINSHQSTPDFIACAGTGCNASPYSSFKLGTVGSNTVKIIPVTTLGGTTPVTDSSRVGPVVVVAPPNNIASSSGTIRIDNSGNGSGKITNITVNGVEVLDGGLSNFGSNGTSNRNNAASAVKDRINAYLNTTPWEYTARVNTSCGGQSASSNRVCIDAPLSAGSSPNGYVINVTVSSTGGVTTSKSTFSGGKTGQINTTSIAISAGAGASSPFERVDIVSTNNSYPKSTTRTDCLSTTCTYAEEMTNFANWYAYYRTRNQAMKTAAGHAFQTLTDGYRVGFTTINNTSFNNNTAGGTNWLPALDLTSAHKNNWYTKLYAASGSSATPLRNALNRIGQYFSGTLSGTNSPIQYSCQQNFSILTTDGYWNETYSGVGNVDNTDDATVFCTRANGCFDGGTGASDTLSDVAAYYYRTDLRPDLENNVPVSSSDPNLAQHMTTFTLGLGVDGVMQYRPDYETATSGDFYRIKTGGSGCGWASGTCNWPLPLNLQDTAVDDLWHAAVSGHGKYFSAQDPAAISAGLSEALKKLQERTGSAAASSTSSPNITQDDNFEFSATFRTVKWDGELVKQAVDVATGETLPTVLWSAREQLNSKSEETSDTRIIYTIGSTVNSRRLFDWSVLNTTEKAWFSNVCAGTGLLSQCISLTTGEKTVANDGEKLVNYLRGQTEMEAYIADTSVPDPVAVAIYRDRQYILGDIAGSKPAYLAKPRRKFSDDGYESFVTSNASRSKMLYAGSNGGMLHAFNADSGVEQWAYVPRIIMPEMYRLASNAFSSDHRYFVDGIPTIGDAYNGSTWKTLLVGGLNKGGRGYYAIDITDPANPNPLWEICSDATLCPLSSDVDMGYSFGEAVITKRPSDGKWVVIVTSGYNNVLPGNGKGYAYVLDAFTGVVLNKIDTNFGTTADPSGLAKVSDYTQDADTNNTATLLYGGDLYGNLWRFDLSTNTVVKLASLTSPDGQVQPITTHPEVGLCTTNNNAIKKMVFVGTGRYLGATDVVDSQMQSVWGIADSTSPLSTLRLSGNMVEQTLSAVTGGYALTRLPVDLNTKQGWFIDLDQNSGERVNLDPTLVNGNLITLTNIPTVIGSAACGTGGRAYLYEFDYCNGSGFPDDSQAVVGKMISNSIVVGYTVVGLPGGVVVKTTSADGSKSTTQVSQKNSATGSTKRVSWRELTD